MAPKCKSTTETNRKVLSLVSGVIAGRRRENWCNRKLAFRLAKSLATSDKKEIAGMDVCALLSSADPIAPKVLNIGLRDSEVTEFEWKKTTDDECSKPLLDDYALDGEASSGFAWDLLKRELTKLHPNQLRELKERLDEHRPADGDCLASLFFCESTFEWLMTDGGRIFDCVSEDDRVTEEMKVNLSRLDPSTEDDCAEGEYAEGIELRRENLSRLNESMTHIMTYQFMCESLAEIPNQWPGFRIAKDFFAEKGLECQKLNGIGEVIDVEVFTHRWVEKKPGEMLVNCELYSVGSLRREYRVPRDLTFLNWLSNATKAIEDREAEERRSGSKTEGKWRDLLLSVDRWFSDYVMTRTPVKS